MEILESKIKKYLVTIHIPVFATDDVDARCQMVKLLGEKLVKYPEFVKLQEIFDYDEPRKVKF